MRSLLALPVSGVAYCDPFSHPVDLGIGDDDIATIQNHVTIIRETVSNLTDLRDISPESEEVAKSFSRY